MQIPPPPADTIAWATKPPFFNIGIILGDQGVAFAMEDAITLHKARTYYWKKHGCILTT